MKNPPEPLYFQKREDWRAWLEKHFQEKDEVWLQFPKKASGKPRTLYNDAVEEALCFGWIDSIIRAYDEESSIQRFSRRREKSSYSQQNRERLRWLAERGLLHPTVEEATRAVREEEFVFPEDILDAIRADETAWENYQNFSDSYRRIRVAYIDTARKRPEEFSKRLINFIKKCKENKQVGYGGIEKYY